MGRKSALFDHKLRHKEPTASNLTTTTETGTVNIVVTDFLLRRYGRNQKSRSGSTTNSIEGFSIGTASGSVSHFDDATGMYNSYLAAAGAGSIAGTIGQSGTDYWTMTAWDPIVCVGMKTHTDITSQRIFIGMFDAAPTNTDNPTDNSHSFRYVAGTDTNWQAISRSSSNTVTNTGVAVAADTRYVFIIRATATNALFYINNTLVATHTTTLPSTSVGMGCYCHLFNMTAAQRAIRVSFITSMTY